MPVRGQHQSCCAVIENCQRCLFFIPQPGTFTGDELATLESDAASDPSQKIALIRHLHVGLITMPAVAWLEMISRVKYTPALALMRTCTCLSQYFSMSHLSCGQAVRVDLHQPFAHIQDQHANALR